MSITSLAIIAMAVTSVVLIAADDWVNKFLGAILLVALAMLFWFN